MNWQLLDQTLAEENISFIHFTCYVCFLDPKPQPIETNDNLNFNADLCCLQIAMATASETKLSKSRHFRYTSRQNNMH